MTKKVLIKKCFLRSCVKVARLDKELPSEHSEVLRNECLFFISWLRWSNLPKCLGDEQVRRLYIFTITIFTIYLYYFHVYDYIWFCMYGDKKQRTGQAGIALELKKQARDGVIA